VRARPAVGERRADRGSHLQAHADTALRARPVRHRQLLGRRAKMARREEDDFDLAFRLGGLMAAQCRLGFLLLLHHSCNHYESVINLERARCTMLSDASSPSRRSVVQTAMHTCAERCKL
jgi:hypothetical protein